MLKIPFRNLLLILFVGFVSLHSGWCQKGAESTYISTVKGSGDSLPPGYVPPLVSNGSLSMLVDYKGCQTQKSFTSMIPNIYWAGRRYGPPNDGLISFGHFDQELSVNGNVLKTPTSWAQTLDKKEAIVTCQNDYGDGLTVETVVFTHLSHDLIVVRKRISAKSTDVTSVIMTFKYQLTPPGIENITPKRMLSKCTRNEKSGSVDFQFEADGYKMTNGIISLFSDKPFVSTINGQVVDLVSKFELNVKEPVEITYYLLFADSMDGDDYLQRAEQLQQSVIHEGVVGIMASHIKKWGEYWDESYVNLPNHHLEDVYNTAQYHLRVNATKWSFPVGIYSPSHWKGRYFGWDEMFCFQALASSNHLSISKRCPEFRFSVLPRATHRVAHYGKPGLYGARYPWETLEDGIEGAPHAFGFWSDHVFHMSNIALSCWLQYLYNGDIEYLKSTGYPVIMECARFFVSHMVYENSDGSMFIGKCTDLERLGPARQNPFMTVCGAIYTLEAAAKAAKLLNENADEIGRWEHIATKLRESLPNENDMYLPYAGCEEKSVASLGGLFPYPIFNADNKLQRKAVYDFVINGRASGNMYPMGKAVCAWYAGWIASALALLNDGIEPEKLLIEAAEGAGCFAELFEINEPALDVVRTPWFATASGNYIYGINQMLIQSHNDEIRIAPAIPDTWKDFSFKLACYGDLVASVRIDKGRITKLILSPGNVTEEINRTIIIQERYLDKKIIRKLKSSIIIKDGICRIDARFKGNYNLLDL